MIISRTSLPVVAQGPRPAASQAPPPQDSYEPEDRPWKRTLAFAAGGAAISFVPYVGPAATVWGSIAAGATMEQLGNPKIGTVLGLAGAATAFTTTLLSASGSAPASLLANAAVGGITWGYAAYRYHDTF